LAQATGFAGAGTALLLAGACGGLGGSVIPACIQTHVQPEFRGRVMSYYSLLSLVTPALSGALFAAAADAWGVAWALQASAATLVLVAAVAGLVLKGVRRYV
jgi:MFS family permease